GGATGAVSGGEAGGGFTVGGEESWERVNYPVALVASGSERLRLRLAYDEGVVSTQQAQGLLRHLQNLLSEMAARPEARVTSLPMLDEAEQQALLALGRGATTATKDESGATTGTASDSDNINSSAAVVRVEELILEQARLHPDTIAVTDERVAYSYAELVERAERLAARLRETGVGAEDVVSVLLPRSADAVWAMLGAWLAGAAYAPLDASYPRERLAAMVEDCGARCVISRRGAEAIGNVNDSDHSDDDSEGINDALATCTRVWLDDFEAQRAQVADAQSRGVERLSGETLAYVIYTSGSTGRPKGVGVTHRGLLNLAQWHAAEYGVTVDDRATQIASLSFDASAWEVWPALCAGATVEVVPEGARGDWVELGRWMREREITVSFLPTPIAEELLNAGVELPSTLRLLSVGGDRLRRWAEPGARYELANIYGPTEITIASNCGTVAACGVGLPPLGRAIANTQVYVLDGAGELCPVGVSGELYVGGTGVARGYINRPELTAEKFVPDAFGGQPGARLYRTGDVVRWREDGQLDFLGRQDAQVKLRGHRIELGEIESALSKHAAVGQCAVTVAEVAGTQMLVAYVAGEADAAGLREHVARQLPSYMVPQRVVKLDALPLTTNGKIDRKALPVPDASDINLFAEPQTAAQEILCDIWAEVLGRERVGIHDNFFELGGDSILSIQVVARATQSGLSITTRDLFERQTVAELSRAVSGERTTRAEKMSDGGVPLTPIQHWFMQQARQRPWHFNHAVLLADATHIDGARLQTAVERVLAAHEVFDLRYERDAESGKVRQHYAGRAVESEGTRTRRCGRVDLRVLPQAAQGRVIEEIAAHTQASLNLESGRLVAALRFEVTGSVDGNDGSTGDGGRLLVVAHHLVIDGVSWRILLDQVERVYQDLQAGRESALRGQGSSFGQWVHALVREAESEETQGELAYWVTQQPRRDERLPRDSETGANTVESSESIAVEFDKAQTDTLLREVPRRMRAQVEEVLVLGVVAALQQWSGSKSVIVECEGHGREPLAGVDVTQTVGWFTTLFPVRFTQTTEGDVTRDSRGATSDNGSVMSNGDVTIAERLREVRDRLRGVPRKGLGYGLLKYVGQAEELRDASAEVSFNYLGQWDANLGGMFRGGSESAGESQWEGEERSHLIGVNGSVSGGRLRVVWTFSRNLHKAETMERVAELFRRTVEAVAAACGEQSESPAPVEVSDLSFSDAEWKALLTAVRS
ncbi:MAG: hypothetical protein QOG00_2652, partial [Pyrinomonadaceae bacterium]|nr:hypothetical protein [Pyrinomonadaceae bacterium]